jgi:signal peptidase I
MLGKGMSVSFTAKGFSMAPFIKDGDVLTVVPLEGTSPVSGDVVAFFRPGTEKLTIHRVIGEEGDSYWMRGDNSLQADGFIPKTSILGRVKRVERNGKKVYLGLGLERFLIAFLNRRGLIYPLLSPIRRVIRLLIHF